MQRPGWKRIEPGHYLHLETGIKVRRRAAHRDFGYRVGLRWELIIPNREGSRTWGTVRTLEQAQQKARVLFPEARTEIAEAWDMAHYALPDPNITGPCQVQASPFCEPSAGRQRMDPMDMAEPETSFRAYTMICQPCYDARADLFVATVHGRVPS
jgi:hypothetical protein